MSQVCPLCEGSGMRLLERADGSRAVADCRCREQRRFARQVASAQIPDRYEHCTLDDYEPSYNGANRSLANALIVARNFVRAYPFDTAGNGLLLTGSIGVGKTHLAIGILRELVVEKGVRGTFFDYRDLLKQIQNSYNRSSEATEMEILRPVFEAEVLVLDELGAGRATEWVWDTVAHILNTRYNDRRTTLLTTNYANLPPSGLETGTAMGMARAATREETLGDRIGERMRSRLQEMCVPVEMSGVDFRQRVSRAAFAPWVTGG